MATYNIGQINEPQPPPYTSIEEFIKIESGFTDDELQKFLVSPEYATYLKITNPEYILDIQPYDKHVLHSFLVSNYKPYEKVLIRNNIEKYGNSRCINYDEELFDLFFVDNNALQIVQDIEHVYAKHLMKLYLCNLHNIAVPDRSENAFFDFFTRCKYYRKEYVHVVLCNLADVYYAYCKVHQRQKRASVSMIYEESNRKPAESDTDRVFANEYIVSRILDFF
jgi:hypothetical protein